MYILRMDLLILDSILGQIIFQICFRIWSTTIDIIYNAIRIAQIIPITRIPE